MQEQESRLVLGEFLMLLQETRDFHKSTPVLYAIFKDAVTKIFSLQRQLKLGTQRYVAALAGMTNVGKSTLLNALFETNIAPRRNGPCTAVPIEFEYGNALNVRVYFSKTLNRPIWDCSSIEEAQERLTELADDSGAEQSQMIQRIVVESPNELLRNGMVLGDTPGFGAAQLESAAGSHELALTNYLTTCVSKVFWVVMADQGIGATECKFYEKYFQSICWDIIVTGSEDWDETDRGRFKAKYLPILKNPQIRFHFVSGKMGVRAINEGNAEMYAESGILELKRTFHNVNINAKGLEFTIDETRKLCEDLVYWLKNYAQNHRAPAFGWWRPDSLFRWQNVYKNIPLKKEIENFITQIQ